MRKLKFNLGEGGAKGFFIRHVEKIVLAVSVLLVALFFCMGYTVQKLPADKTPSALLAKIQEVKTHIDKPTWETLALVRTPEMRHPQRVDDGRLPNPDGWYRLGSFQSPLGRQKTPRTDPKSFAPIKIELL